LSLPGVSEDLVDLVYKSLALLGRKVSGVDGLFVGLEVAGYGFLREVLVYEADDGVNLLAVPFEEARAPVE
jgi:hypothetical protein